MAVKLVAFTTTLFTSPRDIEYDYIPIIPHRFSPFSIYPKVGMRGSAIIKDTYQLLSLVQYITARKNLIALGGLEKKS